jgi:endonuclease/exonuclease/phosphatase family metal-dependent hydrolase
MTMRRLAAVAAALLVTAVPAAQARPAHHDRGHGPTRLTVMTRNLYLGTDLNPIFNAPNQLALFAAVGAGWTQVQSNDFPERAQAIADEIASAKPDLVGLQEAMLYRTQVPPDGPATPAQTVAYDFVQLLVDALAQRGLQYAAVSTFTGTDAELPAFVPPTMDIRLTDRVVVLARTNEKEGDLVLSNPQSGAYATDITVPTVAGPITLRRGWASIDVSRHGREFRFVTTHLESFSGAVRNAQATQLLSGPAATDLPVVLVGDMNSGPGGDPGAYGILTGALQDAWSAGAGLTCCHADDLHDPNPTLRERVDLVLTRGGFETVSAAVVGDQLADRTPSGLWPSDHAGVVTTLRLPKAH